MPARQTHREAGVLLLAGVLAFMATMLTPKPESTAQAVLAGWPRLLLYALSGALLALTARSGRTRTVIGARSVPAKSWILPGLAVLTSVILARVNEWRLSTGITDPMGPLLWLLSMALLGATLLPAARRIGWRPLWLGWRHVTRPRPALAVLVGLLALAAAARLVALGEVPPGINPDEGDRAAVAFDVLAGHAPPSWFDSGWFFINMIYFRLLATSMAVFGPTVAGGRMLSALGGIAFVGAIAWIGCRQFGWRVGLVATTFAAGMSVTLQHSRLISEAGLTGLLWAVSIGGFLEGIRSGRMWAWVVAGLSGGLSLYFYPAARLWAVGAILTTVLVLLRYRQRWVLAGIAVAAAASFVAAAPFLAHLSRHRDEVAARYAETAVADVSNQVRLAYLTPPEPWPELMALQVERTVGMFDRYPDGGGFLPGGRPLFGAPLAELALVGAMYLLVRAWRDTRLAILSLWFWLGLSGVALTVETPDFLRSVGMLPSLCFVLAVPLVELAGRVGALVGLKRGPLLGAATGLIALLLVTPEAVSYFRTYRTLPDGWGPTNREGQLIASLGGNGPVYSLEMNEHLVSSGWVRLLASRTQRGRVPNPGRELPILAPPADASRPAGSRPEVMPDAGQGLSVVLSQDPNQRPYVDLLRRLYPGGTVASGGDGRLVFRVGPAALAATRGVTVVEPSGATRAVDSFGRVPSDVPLPADLTWHAGVLLPERGAYRLTVDAPAAHLRVDGVEIAGPSGPGSGAFEAAPGMHFVELEASLSSAAEHVTLTLARPGLPSHALTPAETYRLMDGPWGLLGRVRSGASDAGLVTRWLDATIAMAFFEPEVGPLTPPASIVWSGWLVAPRSGVYRMAFAAEDAMRLQVDGSAANVEWVKPEQWATVGQGSPLYLTEGPHRVTVTLDVTHGGRELARWNWVPPAASGQPDTATEWAVVPPDVLRPDPSLAVRAGVAG